MWLEGLLAFAFSLPVSLGVALPILYRSELKRGARILRAEIGDRFKKNTRHLSIEMAMHLDADVDMKWWQDEFDKLARAAVSDDWMTGVEREFYDHLAPTSAEWGGWMDKCIVKVTDGDMSYRFGSLAADDHDLAVDLSHHAQMLATAFSQGMVSAKEFRESLEEKQAANQRDAAPPGMDVSLGEARRAGVSLEVARRALINSIRGAKGVDNVPHELSTMVREDIDEATTWEMLIDAATWANTALKTYREPEPDRCESCEYVEEMTYASKYVKHRVTRQCERCLAEDVAHRIKEISGYWG